MSEDDPLWQVVPITDYHVPVSPAKTEAGRKLSGILRLFRPNTKLAEPAKAQQNLSSITEKDLRGLTPAFNWHEAAQALENHWAEWRQQPALVSPVRFLVGPPYSGQDKILHIWGSKLGWDILPIPDRPQLMDHSKSWLNTVLNSPPTNGWIIPNLEHCFLRDASGLDFIRQLLEAIFSGRLGRGAIACDSWAWSYLQWIWPVSAQQVFCMQGLKAEQLANFYRKHIRLAENIPVKILHANSGEDLLSTASEQCHHEFRWLAAITRGNPGICRYFWQSNLHKANEKDQTTKEANSNPGLFWWSPPKELPYIPVDNAEQSALLLHVLLLHNGLPLALLVKLLPIAPAQTLAMLYRFEQLGLISQYHDNWRVAPLAYAVVKDFLSKSGYQTDLF